MKSLIVLTALTMLGSSDHYDPPFAVKGIMRIDKIADGNVICYVAQNKDGSTHTTPAIYCLKN